MSCGKLRRVFLKQIEEFATETKVVFVVGEPGCKHSHILAYLPTILLNSTIIHLLVWPDLNPVPTLLDLENRITDCARRTRQVEPRAHVREALRSISPALDLPGEVQFLTEEGVYLKLYKAKGWERLFGLLDIPDRAVVMKEMLEAFNRTISDCKGLWPNNSLRLAIDIRGPLDEIASRFIADLTTVASIPVMVAGEELGAIPKRHPVVRIPRLTRGESDNLLNDLGIDPRKYEVVWQQAKGLPLLTLLMSMCLVENVNTDFGQIRSEFPTDMVWQSLSHAEQKILAELIIMKADVELSELSTLVKLSEEECKIALGRLTSGGLVDEIGIMPHLPRTYVVDPCASRNLEAFLPSEIRVEVSNAAGSISLPKVINDPVANPIATARCSSYFLTSGKDDAYRQSVLRSVPILLTWGATENLRNNLEHAMQVTDDSGFYLQYFQAILDLEDKDYEAARRKLQKALADLEAAHVGPVASIVARHWLARTYERLGIFDEALRIMEGVVLLIRQWAETATEFAGLLAVSLSNKGLLLRKLGRLRDAMDAFKEAYTLDSAAENLQGQAQDLRGLAFALQDSDRLEEALQLHQAALELDRRISNITGQAIDHGNIGSILLALGRIDESRNQLLEAKTLFERLNAQVEALQINELIASLEPGGRKAKTN